jgi:hypothetical protein
MTKSMTTMNQPAHLILALAASLAGCSATTHNPQDISPGGPGDGNGGDLPPPPQAPCVIGLDVAPRSPVAGATTVVHVAASPSHMQGVPSYDWRVEFDGAPVPFTVLETGTEIEFAAPDPGVYDVGADLGADSANMSCQAALLPVNVAAPNARIEMMRLRVLPPPSMIAPPIEKLRPISGGATVNIGTITVDAGLTVALRVMGPEGGVPAYLRFTPTSAPDAIVEAFADASGSAAAVLSPQPHDVLIIPSVDGVAPRRLTGWLATNPLVVDAGTLVTGTVTGPTVTGPEDAPVAHATVQLTIDGVPSAPAMTSATGQFAVRVASSPSGMSGPSGPVTVEVVPDPASGLPRLSATSSSWSLAVPLDIHYATNLARKNLAGITVQRVRQGQPTPLAHARVTFVGALITIGMVTAGTRASATGTVRITTTTDASGTLPSLLVPSASLSAVIEVTPGDLAVVNVNTAATVPATLEAPPMQLIATTALGGGSGPPAALPDAVLDIVPIGALAIASAPTLHVTADASGAITALLASGGHYDLRFRDPVGRRAPLVVADRVVSTIELSYPLPPVLQLRGTVTLDGLQAMPNAAVQLLCNLCSGLDRDRPIAETVTNHAGQFVLAVPDPGTM